MGLPDLLVTFAGFYGPAREALRREWVLEARATSIRQRRLLSRDDARAIAAFSLGGWAQRYPVRSTDLGEDLAHHVADWLSARSLGPSAENMDASLREWRGGEVYGRMCAAIARV